MKSNEIMNISNKLNGIENVVDIIRSYINNPLFINVHFNFFRKYLILFEILFLKCISGI